MQDPSWRHRHVHVHENNGSMKQPLRTIFVCAVGALALHLAIRMKNRRNRYERGTKEIEVCR